MANPPCGPLAVNTRDWPSALQSEGHPFFIFNVIDRRLSSRAGSVPRSATCTLKTRRELRKEIVPPLGVAEKPANPKSGHSVSRAGSPLAAPFVATCTCQRLNQRVFGGASKQLKMIRWSGVQQHGIVAPGSELTMWVSPDWRFRVSNN